MSKKNTSRPNKGQSLIAFPNDYIVIDIETTGLSPVYDAIIEISALKVEENIIIDKFTTLVNPGYSISEFITELTGITNEMVKDSPKIDVALDMFKEFVDDSIVVGHNANFDINFIYDNFKYEKSDIFSNNFIDTMRLSKRLLPELKHHRLCDICEHFGISNDKAHRALVDCEHTYRIFNFLKDVAIDKYDTIYSFIEDCKPKKYDLTTCVSLKTEFDVSHPLYNKICVFTGTLEKMTRSEAAQIVVDFGGSCGNSVTKKTNFLILGNNDYCTTIKDGKSIKQKSAEQLKLKGSDIEIITESVFYDMIEDCYEECDN